MAITYEQALAPVLPAVRTRGVHEVPLPDVVGEILVRDFLAGILFWGLFNRKENGDPGR